MTSFLLFDSVAMTSTFQNYNKQFQRIGIGLTLTLVTFAGLKISNDDKYYSFIGTEEFKQESVMYSNKY